MNPRVVAVGAMVYFSLANTSQATAYNIHPITNQQIDSLTPYQIPRFDSNGSYSSAISSKSPVILSLKGRNSLFSHIHQINRQISEQKSKQYKYLLTTLMSMGLFFLTASRRRRVNKKIFIEI